MTAVSLSGRLPTDDKDGLAALAARFTDHPEHLHLVVGLVGCTKVTRDVESDEEVPTVRFRHIESCEATSKSATTLREILEHLYGERTGKWSLPGEIKDFLDGLNLNDEDAD